MTSGLEWKMSPSRYWIVLVTGLPVAVSIVVRVWDFTARVFWMMLFARSSARVSGDRIAH